MIQWEKHAEPSVVQLVRRCLQVLPFPGLALDWQKSRRTQSLAEELRIAFAVVEAAGQRVAWQDAAAARAVLALVPLKQQLGSALATGLAASRPSVVRALREFNPPSAYSGNTILARTTHLAIGRSLLGLGH